MSFKKMTDIEAMKALRPNDIITKLRKPWPYNDALAIMEEAATEIEALCAAREAYRGSVLQMKSKAEVKEVAHNLLQSLKDGKIKSINIDTIREEGKGESEEFIELVLRYVVEFAK